MSERFTNTTVRRAFAELVAEATACGIDTTGWDVDMAGGSVRNYKIMGRGVSALAGGFGSIGTTAKEATRVLETARAAMAMVRTARQG